MLELYTKRKIVRLIAQNKAVEIMQTPLEVLKSPTGVANSSMIECHNIAILHTIEKLEKIDELLMNILAVTKEPNAAGE